MSNSRTGRRGRGSNGGEARGENAGMKGSNRRGIGGKGGEGGKYWGKEGEIRVKEGRNKA